MSKPAARVGDMHTCPMVTPGLPPIPHVGGPILPPGVPTVLIGGMPAATLSNMCICVGPPDTIILGSMGVFIGGKPAARLGDSTGHGGVIIMGCPTVLIGDITVGVPLLKSPCAILSELQKEPQNEAEKQKQAELQKELADSIKQNLANIPPEKRADALNTADHYQKTADAADNARLSNAAYGFNIVDGKAVPIDTPLGYKKVEGDDLKALGLSERDLKDDNSGFKSAVYESTTGKDPKYTVAFAGTETHDENGNLDMKDIKTDAKQGAGMQDDQYDSALLLGKKMRTAVGPDGFSTTGHSLGGGLASAASATSGAKGSTYNAAGLHPNTTSRSGIDTDERNQNQQNVTSYQNTTCPLSVGQNNRGKVLTGLAGAAAFLIGPFTGGFVAGLGLAGALPKAYGNKIEVPPTSKALEGHGIGAMINLLDEQVKQDLDSLKNQLGCP